MTDVVPGSELHLPDENVSERLRAAFQAEEATLRAALERARADFDHRGVRGDAVERAVRAFLGRHLPRKYTVGTGELIDRYGGRSSQLDVIVLSDDAPFTQDSDTPGLYFVEGAAAVGEIKTSLGSGDLDDILAKGERLRRVRPESAQGDMAYASPGDIARYYQSVPYFALALETTLLPSTILTKLRSADDVETSRGTRLPMVDALFVLDAGVFWNFGDGTGALAMTDGPDLSDRATGWLGPLDDKALLSLFTWLNATMPIIQRRSSIALPYLLAQFRGPRTS